MDFFTANQRQQQRQKRKLWIKLALLIACAAFVCPTSSFVAAKLINEFTLDELTGAESSYQPFNFGPHQSGGRISASSLASSGGDGQPAGAHGQHPSGNRGQQIERKTCHPTKPFLCPSDDPQTGECIPIQYLCDGSFDCPAYTNSAGGYDEDPLLCTAAKRPPVEETANFLRTLITNHGPQYIEKLFGGKMSQALVPLGGPERVAIALSVSKTIEDFGKALHLMRGDIDHLRNVLVAVQTMDGTMLKNLGIVRNTELSDMKFFLEKLLSTGFLD